MDNEYIEKLKEIVNRPKRELVKEELSERIKLVHKYFPMVSIDGAINILHNHTNYLFDSMEEIDEQLQYFKMKQITFVEINKMEE